MSKRRTLPEVRELLTNQVQHHAAHIRTLGPTATRMGEELRKEKLLAKRKSLFKLNPLRVEKINLEELKNQERDIKRKAKKIIADLEAHLANLNTGVALIKSTATDAALELTRACYCLERAQRNIDTCHRWQEIVAEDAKHLRYHRCEERTLVASLTKSEQEAGDGESSKTEKEKIIMAKKKTTKKTSKKSTKTANQQIAELLKELETADQKTGRNIRAHLRTLGHKGGLGKGGGRPAGKKTSKKKTSKKKASKKKTSRPEQDHQTTK